mgnify:CR=1 FL=1
MYVDYHNHTVLCHHATGTVDEYLERAAEMEIDEFGFAEHSYWMIRPDGRNLCPSRSEMDTYLEWMEDKRLIYDGKHGNPMLRVGLEADWVPDRVGEAMRFIDSYPFDYVLGSVHHLVDPSTDRYVCTWWFDSDDVDEVYRRYFEAVGELAKSGMCDILAHLDVIRRCGRLPKRGLLPYFEEILPAIVESGVAVEINASGLDHTGRDFFPRHDILKLLVESGVPITFGSDGHAVEHVGRYMMDVKKYLADAGGTEFVRFERRKKLPTNLTIGMD